MSMSCILVGAPRRAVPMPCGSVAFRAKAAGAAPSPRSQRPQLPSAALAAEVLSDGPGVQRRGSCVTAALAPGVGPDAAVFVATLCCAAAAWLIS